MIEMLLELMILNLFCFNKLFLCNVKALYVKKIEYEEREYKPFDMFWLDMREEN